MRPMTKKKFNIWNGHNALSFACWRNGFHWENQQHNVQVTCLIKSEVKLIISQVNEKQVELKTFFLSRNELSDSYLSYEVRTAFSTSSSKHGVTNFSYKKI